MSKAELSGAKGALIVVLMLGLLGAYFYLNGNKIERAIDDYSLLLASKAANELALSANGETLARFRFPESDIFDAQNEHELTFYRIAPERFARLHEQAASLKVRLNGQDIDTKVQGQGEALLVPLPMHRLYLLNGDDVRTMAAVIDANNRSRRATIGCFGPAELCAQIKLTALTPAGEEGGPYLGTDIDTARRGLPRGQWVYGPATTLGIEAAKPMTVRMLLVVLGLAADQQIKIEGPVIRQGFVPAKRDNLLVGDKHLYPKQQVADLDLQAGPNEVTIRYSYWLSVDNPGQPPYAGYMTMLQFRPVGGN